MNKILIILSLSLLLFAGCNNTAISVDDGVLRSDNGTSLLTIYDDIPTSSHEQTALFEGRQYGLSGHFTLGMSQSQYFLGCTQDKAIHFEDFSISFSATPIDIHFYESPTITNNGTRIYGYNWERNYNYNTTLITYINTTFSNSGTQLFHSTAYGGNNLVGNTVMPSEMILKINTCYLFEITNNDGNNVNFNYNFIWHDSGLNYTDYFN